MLDDPPGDGLAATLAGLRHADLPDAELVDMMRAGARLVAWAEARVVDALAELGRRRREQPPASGEEGRTPEDLDADTAAEVAVALTVSEGEAMGRLTRARQLTTTLCRTHEALRSGRLDAPRVRRICEAVSRLPDDVARQVEADVLPRAPEQTVTGLQRSLTKAVHRADPQGAERRTALANRDRGCGVRMLDDGMAMLWLIGRAELVVGAYRRLDEVARGLVGPAGGAGEASEAGRDGTGEAGTDSTGGTGTDSTGEAGTDSTGERVGVRQARADVALGVLAGDPDSLAAVGGVSVELGVVAPLATLLGLSEDPGELVGYGALDAAAVRELGEDAVWRRWLCDERGVVADIGRRRYRPSAAMVALLRARDGTCRFPGCPRRASGCDLDHTVPFPRGDTEPTNLAALCRRHHRLKHGGRWQVTQHDDGRLSWTTPTGQVRVTEPARWLSTPTA